jgi:uncharacterized protein YcbX
VTVSHAEPDQVVAQVAHLRTTPVKGFAMRESRNVFLSVGAGVEGDRAFFLMDRAGRLMSATRTACFLRYWASFDPAREVLAIGRGGETLIEERVVADGAAQAHFFGDRHASGRLVRGPWNRFLSEIAGQPVRLVRATGPLGGFDVHPVSLLAGASVRALTDSSRDPLDGRRFRMTITVEGVPAFGEDAWLGSALRIGESIVRVTSRVRRCAAVQKDPDGAEGGEDPLRRIKQVRGTATTPLGRGLCLGVYGDVERSGAVRLEDSVRPMAWG